MGEGIRQEIFNKLRLDNQSRWDRYNHVWRAVVVGPLQLTMLVAEYRWVCCGAYQQDIFISTLLIVVVVYGLRCL